MSFILNLIGNLKPICINVKNSPIQTIGDLKQYVEEIYGISKEEQKISTYSGKYLKNEDNLKASIGMNHDFQITNLSVSVLGGKGGFGSMLRAQGGKMSSKKTTNVESCRDLQGRRLKTINDATKLVEYLNKESERKRKRKEEIDKKIEEGLQVHTKKRHRFDDMEYFENHDKIMENIKGAVAQACSKGIKKDKGKGKEKEKEIKSLGIWDDLNEYDLSESDEEEEEEDSDNGSTSSSSQKADIPTSSNKNLKENSNKK